MAVTPLKTKNFKFWERPAGICGNENGIPPLLKWDYGRCKPKIVPRSQLGVKSQNETRCNITNCIIGTVFLLWGSALPKNVAWKPKSYGLIRGHNFTPRAARAALYAFHFILFLFTLRAAILSAQKRGGAGVLIGWGLLLLFTSLPWSFAS